MLTGAVCGDIFTSPSSTSILDTIQTCTKDGGSALLIVKNYTGMVYSCAILFIAETAFVVLVFGNYFPILVL